MEPWSCGAEEIMVMVLLSEDTSIESSEFENKNKTKNLRKQLLKRNQNELSEKSPSDFDC